mmetsp:Transcript_24802/g.41658  ORF Transcript_24802/g.41658 Transcript_24802/m.41658 type:complete len:776 (-) Transcript_24802:70-2397(-)
MSQSGSLIGKKRAGDKIGCAPHAPAPLRMKVDPDHKSRREVHCDEVIGKTMMSQKQMHEAAKNNGMERLIGAAIGKMPRNPPPEVLPNVSMESFHPFGVDNAEGNNAITYKSILTLEPEKFAEVSNMNTYLYVNGHRSKDVIRVSRRIKDTQPYHGERIEFERPGLLVSFSRFNAFAQILKKISKNTVYMCGKIMLKCNSPIKTVELLNKQGLQIKGKNYPARLYPLSYSSTALSSRHAGEKPRTHSGGHADDSQYKLLRPAESDGSEKYCCAFHMLLKPSERNNPNFFFFSCGDSFYKLRLHVIETIKHKMTRSISSTLLFKHGDFTLQLSFPGLPIPFYKDPMNEERVLFLLANSKKEETVQVKATKFVALQDIRCGSLPMYDRVKVKPAGGALVTMDAIVRSSFRPSWEDVTEDLSSIKSFLWSKGISQEVKSIVFEPSPLRLEIKYRFADISFTEKDPRSSAKKRFEDTVSRILKAYYDDVKLLNKDTESSITIAQESDGTLYPTTSSTSCSTGHSSSSMEFSPAPSRMNDMKDFRPDESERKCKLQFSIRLLLPDNHAINYGRLLVKAGELMKKVYGVIPTEYRDREEDIEHAPVRETSVNEKLIEVSLKLMKAEYNPLNAYKITKNAWELWEKTTQLPDGITKGGPPAVTPGCIKITQFFMMGAEAKPSEMLEWLLDEKKHVMSTLMFNGETVGELDIKCSSSEQNLNGEELCDKPTIGQLENRKKEFGRARNHFKNSSAALLKTPERMSLRVANVLGVHSNNLLLLCA